MTHDREAFKLDQLQSTKHIFSNKQATCSISLFLHTEKRADPWMRQISESIHRKPRGKKCSISARFTNWVFPHMYNLQGIPSGLGPEREIRNGNGTGHTRAGMTHANQICKRKQKHTGDMHVNPCGLLCYLEVHFTSIKQN